MVAAAVLATGVVVMLNVTAVLPAGTVTLAGTVIAAKLSLRAIMAPPLGAGPLNVIAPWDSLPPVTLPGLIVRALTSGGL